jgi:PAS domain S-box-containing protein
MGDVVDVLESLFEDATFGLWVRSADDRCVFQNATSRLWHGDLLGKRTDEAPVSPEIRARWQTTNRRAYARELVRYEEEVVVAGARRFHECVVGPAHAGGGIVWLGVDVTDRERRLREVLRIGRMGFITWNFITDHVTWSPETFRLLGHDPDAFAPTHTQTVEMVHEEDRPRVWERLQAAARGELPYDIYHRMVRKDGEVIHVHGLAEIERDETGRAVRLLGTLVDVSELWLAEEARRISEERLQRAMKAASAGSWEWNLRTDELGCSIESYRLYGFDPAGPTPTIAAWKAALHPDDVAPTEAAMRAVIDGRADEYRVEFRVPGAPGGERWILSVGQCDRLPDGTPIVLSGISIDITARKRAELDLREVDRRRSDFLGVLAHELRNPLAPIRNSLYVLDHASPGGEQAHRALAVIDRQVSHLARLVDDLLDVTRVSSGKIRLQRTGIDLAELVRRTVEDHRTLLAGREVAVTLPGHPVWVLGDATRLAQVLGNLLSNAAKFTPEDGKVAVSLRRGARAELVVADTGLGIDADTLRRLFVPFTQADRSLDRSRGGLGLGLALVKSLVEMHGGTVSAESGGPGRGASFRVRLPLDDSVETEAPSPRRPFPEDRRRRKRVLVIEDNADAATSLAEALELSGHDVTIAGDGPDGLARAHEIDPDVVVCDIGLPGAMDGYAVARALATDPSVSSAFRIALTGYAQPEDQQRSHDAGFQAHFAKPPSIEALEKVVAGSHRS